MRGNLQLREKGTRRRVLRSLHFAYWGSFTQFQRCLGQKGRTSEAATAAAARQCGGLAMSTTEWYIMAVILIPAAALFCLMSRPDPEDPSYLGKLNRIWRFKIFTTNCKGPAATSVNICNALDLLKKNFSNGSRSEDFSSRNPNGNTDVAENFWV